MSDETPFADTARGAALRDALLKLWSSVAVLVTFGGACLIIFAAPRDLVLFMSDNVEEAAPPETNFLLGVLVAGAMIAWAAYLFINNVLRPCGVLMRRTDLASALAATKPVWFSSVSNGALMIAPCAVVMIPDWPTPVLVGLFIGLVALWNWVKTRREPVVDAVLSSLRGL